MPLCPNVPSKGHFSPHAISRQEIIVKFWSLFHNTLGGSADRYQLQEKIFIAHSSIDCV